MGKPEHKLVTEEAWRKIMPEIVRRSITLLESSEKLLDSNGNGAVCAGLYMYAVEDYGKLLLLKKYQPVNRTVNITYKEEFCKHPVKFNEATKSANCLPKDCVNLSRGLFDPAIFDTKNTKVESEARMAIFYTDFNDKGDGIVPIPPVEKNKLKNAIGKLRTIIIQTTIP